MKRKVISRKDERPADLSFWLKDGLAVDYCARVAASTEVSIGRTIKRALGFIVTRGDTSMDFVLDRDQVAELAAYLQHYCPALLKPLGRKQNQLSLVALHRSKTPPPKRERK
jgi:hypothetical protein